MGLKEFFGDLVPKKHDDEFNHEDEKPLYNPLKVSGNERWRDDRGEGPSFAFLADLNAFSLSSHASRSFGECLLLAQEVERRAVAIVSILTSFPSSLLQVDDPLRFAFTLTLTINPFR